MISTQYLFERINKNSNVVITLEMINEIPNKIFNKAKQKSQEYNTKEEFQQFAQDTIQNIIEWNPRKLMSIVKQKQIVPLFSWGNGDHCVYSIEGKKVLDFNHETQDFEPTHWK